MKTNINKEGRKPMKASPSIAQQHRNGGNELSRTTNLNISKWTFSIFIS
jgi:hypothetical protein